MLARVLDISNYKPKVKKKESRYSDKGGKALGRNVLKKDLKKLAEKFSICENENDYRNKAVFYCLMSGARLNELIQFSFANIFQDESGKSIVKVLLKGGKTGFYCLSDKAIESVKEYLSFIKENPKGNFFYSRLKYGQKIRKVLSARGLDFIVRGWKVRKSDGVSIASCHSFRHSTAFLIASQFGIGSASKQLQNSIATCQKYYSLPYFTNTDYLDF